MNCLRFAFVMLLSSLLLVVTARAATLTLDPALSANDAFLSAANPANNYGGAGAIGIAAPGLAKGEFQSVLKYDFATVKSSFDATFGVGGWALTAASLQLTAQNPGNAIFNSPAAAGSFQIRAMQNTSWTEGAGTPMAPSATGINWNSLPTFTSINDQLLGTYSIGAVTSGNFNYTLGLSSLLTAGATSGGTVSLLFSPTAGDTTLAVLFNSRSFTTVANRPQLTLTAEAIPEPGTIGLSFLAGAALLGWKQVRRRQIFR